MVTNLQEQDVLAIEIATLKRVSKGLFNHYFENPIAKKTVDILLGPLYREINEKTQLLMHLKGKEKE